MEAPPVEQQPVPLERQVVQHLLAMIRMAEAGALKRELSRPATKDFWLASLPCRSPLPPPWHVHQQIQPAVEFVPVPVAAALESVLEPVLELVVGLAGTHTAHDLPNAQEGASSDPQRARADSAVLLAAVLEPVVRQRLQQELEND